MYHKENFTESAEEMEGHGKTPKLYLLVYIAMGIFALGYLFMYTPQLSGWQQDKSIVELEVPK